MSQINKSRMQTALQYPSRLKEVYQQAYLLLIEQKLLECNKSALKKDIVSPGHVFPLVSRNGES